MDIHYIKELVFFTLNPLLLTSLVWITNLDLQSKPTLVSNKGTAVLVQSPPKNSNADDAYVEFLKCKAKNKPISVEIDEYLKKIKRIFSSDYCFTLERTIALAAGYGHKEKETLEHNNFYDFLKKADEKALIEEMQTRLNSEKNG